MVKVAFAGIEDDESETESEKQEPASSTTSQEEDVWVKLPPSAKRPPDTEDVTTAGLVVAKPALAPAPLVPAPSQAPPPPPPHQQQPFQSSKLQPPNKCNGIR